MSNLSALLVVLRHVQVAGHASGEAPGVAYAGQLLLSIPKLVRPAETELPALPLAVWMPDSPRKKTGRLPPLHLQLQVPGLLKMKPY